MLQAWHLGPPTSQKAPGMILGPFTAPAPAVVCRENRAVYDHTLQREGPFRALQPELYDKFPQPHHNHKSLIAVRGEIEALQINDSHIKAASPSPPP